MTAIDIKYDDRQVRDALNRLLQAARDMSPVHPHTGGEHLYSGRGAILRCCGTGMRPGGVMGNKPGGETWRAELPTASGLFGPPLK